MSKSAILRFPSLSILLSKFAVLHFVSQVCNWSKRSCPLLAVTLVPRSAVLRLANWWMFVVLNPWDELASASQSMGPFIIFGVLRTNLSRQVSQKNFHYWIFCCLYDYWLRQLPLIPASEKCSGSMVMVVVWLWWSGCAPGYWTSLHHLLLKDTAKSYYM